MNLFHGLSGKLLKEKIKSSEHKVLYVLYYHLQSFVTKALLCLLRPEYKVGEPTFFFLS